MQQASPHAASEEQFDACVEYLHSVRRVKQVHDGLTASSIHFAHALVTHIATELWKRPAPRMPPEPGDKECCSAYDLMCKESLLFHHSMLGPMHVPRATMVDMEKGMYNTCKAYLQVALR
tara:strand:- start:772 stop:1131 length:360 start_codon:yes stop_codon:yes gene_type:complete